MVGSKLSKTLILNIALVLTALKRLKLNPFFWLREGFFSYRFIIKLHLMHADKSMYEVIHTHKKLGSHKTPYFLRKMAFFRGKAVPRVNKTNPQHQEAPVALSARSLLMFQWETALPEAPECSTKKHLLSLFCAHTWQKHSVGLSRVTWKFWIIQDNF